MEISLQAIFKCFMYWIFFMYAILSLPWDMER